MNPIVAVIIACEAGFWIMLATGLAARYLLRRRRLATVLLASVPMLDLLLIIATAVDLAGGGQASTIHGLAAYYLGFSVAFGPSLIRGADIRFAHRFAGGPAPVKPPKGSGAYLKQLWQEWFRVVLATAIAVVVLLVLIYFVAAPGQSGQLWGWVQRAGLITGIWLVAGPCWGLFERAPADRSPAVEAARAQGQDLRQ